MSIIKCDECGKEFKLKEKRIKTEFLDSGYRRLYLRCPNNKCAKDYTIAYSSPRSRELQRQWQHEGSRQGTTTHIELMRELKKVNDYMKLMYK